MQVTVVVILVHVENNIQLFQAVDAVGLLALLLGIGQRRQ